MYSLQRILKTLETLFWNTIRGTGIGGDIYIMRLWGGMDSHEERRENLQTNFKNMGWRKIIVQQRFFLKGRKMIWKRLGRYINVFLRVFFLIPVGVIKKGIREKGKCNKF